MTEVTQIPAAIEAGGAWPVVAVGRALFQKNDKARFEGVPWQIEFSPDEKRLFTLESMSEFGEGGGLWFVGPPRLGFGHGARAPGHAAFVPELVPASRSRIAVAICSEGAQVKEGADFDGSPPR
jgi:hypothetical protein